MGLGSQAGTWHIDFHSPFAPPDTLGIFPRGWFIISDECASDPDGVALAMLRPLPFVAARLDSLPRAPSSCRHRPPPLSGS